MYSGNDLMGLLGKSRSDASVVKLLADLGNTKGIKKPGRGETGSYLEAPEKGIELLFQLAEALPEKIGAQFQEGELVLHTIFFRPPADPDAAIFNSLPKGLESKTSRQQARGLLGKPDWISRVETADRWMIDGLKIHIRFKKDEESIDMLTLSLADDE